MDVAVGGFICAVGTVIFASSFKIGQALKTLRQQVDTTAHRASLTPSQSTTPLALLMKRRKPFGCGRGHDHLLSHVSRRPNRLPPRFSSPTCAYIRQEYTHEELSALFKQHDADGSGALDTAELAALCASLGTTLTTVELESALLLLDADGDGTIRSLVVLPYDASDRVCPTLTIPLISLTWCPGTAARTSFWRGGTAAARCRTPCAAAIWTGRPARATPSGDHFVVVVGDGGKPLIARV